MAIFPCEVSYNLNCRVQNHLPLLNSINLSFVDVQWNSHQQAHTVGRLISYSRQGRLFVKVHSAAIPCTMRDKYLTIHWKRCQQKQLDGMRNLFRFLRGIMRRHCLLATDYPNKTKSTNQYPLVVKFCKNLKYIIFYIRILICSPNLPVKVELCSWVLKNCTFEK